MIAETRFPTWHYASLGSKQNIIDSTSRYENLGRLGTNGIEPMGGVSGLTMENNPH